ncbi:unnamed protein product [Diamesa tonsa]
MLVQISFIVLLLASVSYTQSIPANNTIIDLSVHVLDVARGAAGSRCPVQLYKFIDNDFKLLSSGQTDVNGRFSNFVDNSTNFNIGRYKIRFQTGAYFTKYLMTPSFFPFVDVTIDIQKPVVHYHIPLTLSQFSYSTYKGI